ncbi:MAG: hypothetical protein WC404_02235, partial [Candidatus Omnitrophota bacterium]
ISMPSFKPLLIITFSLFISYRFLRFMVLKLPRILFVDILWNGLRSIKRAADAMAEVYVNKEFRVRSAGDFIEKAIVRAEDDKRITAEEAKVLRDELEGEDVLEMLALFPVWAAIDLITWSVFGYGIVPIFVDGILHCAAAVIFTGFKYKPLLVLSAIPVVGTYIAIPTQMIKNSPHLTEFLMKEVVGSKMGTFFPGVARDSFSEYFYMRFMNIPLFFMRFMAGLISYLDEKVQGQAYETDFGEVMPVADIAVPAATVKEDDDDGKSEVIELVPATTGPAVQQNEPAKVEDKRKDSPVFVSSKNEADRIHARNLEYTPAIPQKTILCHIITDSILPDSQRNMLKLLEKNMRSNDYNEKIVSFSASDPENFMDELKALMARQKEEYKDHTVEFDVACPNIDLVRAILKSDLGIRALAFEAQKDAEINALVQLESIMLALRALHSGKIESLRQAFRIVTGTELSSELGNIEDIDTLAISILFILPVSKTIDYNENRRLNDIIRKNIEVAA